MTGQRPTVLLVMGLVGLGLGIAYAFWLVVAQSHVIVQVLLPAGIGDTKAIGQLKDLNLASPVAIYATSVTFFLELVLTGILLWASTGLISMWPSARWSAVFYAIFMILVGTINVILAVFVLATPSKPVAVLTVLARGVIVLFAIVLWGTMFMPVVTAAYGAQQAPEEIEESPFEQDDEEPEPPPSRRHAKSR